MAKYKRLVEQTDEESKNMNDLYLFLLEAIQLSPSLYHYFYNTFIDTASIFRH